MTDISKVDLNLLKALDVLLDECSVSRAAKRLHLTQPSVSGTLQRLRELFNDPLFIRTQRGLIPTARAQALSPALKKLLSDARKVLNPPEFDPSKAELIFSVSANDAVQIALLVPFITAVRQRAPGIKMAVRYLDIDDATEKMQRGELDLVITFPEILPTTLYSQLLYRDHYVCVVRQQHPIKGKKTSLKRFGQYPQVLVSSEGFNFEGPLYLDLHESNMRDQVVITAPSFSILPSLLQTDDLVSIIPKRLLSVMDHDLRVIEIPIPMPELDVIAAWHPRTEHDPAHEWLRGLLLSVAAGIGP